MSRKSHHVVPRADGWAVVRGGADRASAVAPTKAEAIARGREISRHQQSELVIHGMNGQIQGSDSHGHDPYPPRG